MRLLDTKTGQFVEKDPETTKYGILSHTWDKSSEQTYEELREIQQRYIPSQRRLIDPEVGASSPYSQQDRHGTSPKPPPLQPPSNSPSLMTPLPVALSCFAESEIEALLCLFGEVYGLARPTTPAPAPSDHPAPATEYQPTEPPQSVWDDSDLSPKIRDACAVALRNGFRYIWIDSCCIDKSSSSELSEAINSMYKWYALADMCYAYLADVPPGDDHHATRSAFRKSRWFTRGWTLQELIAPLRVEFLAEDWAPVGSKHALVNLGESITGISFRALLHLKLLERFSVAQRLSWAAKRETTRVEDRAYSLLGIFDINMPTLYCEGNRALRRLQEQIMQRIPDQSLFAWGNVYLSGSQVPSDPIPADEPVTFRTYSFFSQSLSADSPYDFRNSGNIRHVQLPATLRHEIEYTFTPHGIRAQFQMVPLSCDLLSVMFPHTDSDVKLQLEDERSSPWYLAILGCEQREYPGHILGRVCYIPSSDDSVQFVRTGHIELESKQRHTYHHLGLFALSPEVVERFRPHTELKTVYISHPQSDHTDSDVLESLRRQPYTAIQLVLLAETRDALRSRRGYKADLRHPDPDHPTTHWLTLSNDERTITVEFEHILKSNGKMFTINAEVKMSGSRAQLDSALNSNVDRAADCRAVSWSDRNEWPYQWDAKLDHRKVELNGTLTLDLGLDFAGAGVYFVRIDVWSNSPPTPQNMKSMLPVAGSAVESAGDGGKEVELGGDDSPSVALDVEDSKSGQKVEAGGREMAREEARDLKDTSDEAEDGDGDRDGDGALAWWFGSEAGFMSCYR